VCITDLGYALSLFFENTLGLKTALRDTSGVC
jgi:hypothetical protein